ncbi:MULTISPECIES: sigma-E processing peptidase SpoIIGA [Bhargavaea]|uniref:Sigma-E processing peptidase SpoIIGA n=1 Tax=Bhargavaea changchunensis TaxID=2134037 RepID=A0ABW2N8U4_9BACL|nr:sigma-E processing peptidase SpoIIGA [Bhargavaea sp. CC-171006]
MYGEVAIAVNSAFNYLILSFADKVCRRPAGKWRLLAAAVAGALPVVLFGGAAVPTAAAFLAMIMIAFGLHRNSALKGAGATLTAALFAGGLLNVVNPSEFGMGGTAAIFTSCLFASGGLHMLAVRWRGAEEDSAAAGYRVDTELELFGSKIPISAFADSGNACSEPLSGAPVHFIAYRSVKEQLPEEIRRALENLPKEGIPDLAVFPPEVRVQIRPIRLRTVGGSAWAVGFRAGKWTVDNTEDARIGGYFVLTENDAEYPLGADAILHRSSLIHLKERGSTDADRS